MVGHLQLQLRHYASAIVADRNISYGQMLRSGDTVVLNETRKLLKKTMSISSNENESVKLGNIISASYRLC